MNLLNTSKHKGMGAGVILDVVYVVFLLNGSHRNADVVNTVQLDIALNCTLSGLCYLPILGLGALRIPACSCLTE